MKYPNMSVEVIDAIHQMYEDYPDVETDCLLYLQSLTKNQEYREKLATASYTALEEMGRCGLCGTVLETMRHKNRHTELENQPDEVIFEKYCPNCDLGYGT